LLKTTVTIISAVHNEDYPSDQRAASLLSLLDYSNSDSVVSGVRGLISELKPEQHNLHL